MGQHKKEPLPKETMEKKKKKKNRSKSSQAWLERQNRDPYVHKAQNEKAPSRSLYKLQQLEQMIYQKTQQKVFHRRYRVIDLGAAPGGWAKHVLDRIQSQGFLVTVDLLALDMDRATTATNRGPIHTHIQADFRDAQTQDEIQNVLLQQQQQQEEEEEDAPASMGSTQADAETLSSSKTNAVPPPGMVHAVLSDMAPNFTGHASTDALRTMALCESALFFATQTNVLRPGGTFVGKFFTCGPQQEADLFSMAHQHFHTVLRLKPPASRTQSAEVYLCALGFQNQNNKS